MTTYLNNTQLALVQARLQLYLEAERLTGVPWMLLAALHYRESNFAGLVARVGGPFQADPPWTSAQVRAWGSQYSVTDLTDPETDLRTAVICAAAFVQVKAAARGGKLTPASSHEEIADVAFSYNGRAYGTWQNSPYVANDPANGVTLHIRGTVPDTKDPSKRIRIDQVDTRPGVLAIIRELQDRVILPAPPATTPRVLLLDQAGKFVPETRDRFKWQGLMFSRQVNGDLWIRPLTPAEQT